MEDVTVEARENGPYLITGDVAVVDAEGRTFVRPQGTAIALCRCGNSANKPFCDGSHKRFEFHADDVAPRIEN
jgi:CDGSH-type Zn-finger protein